MSYGRPSTRPGELFNQYGPPRPPMGNAHAYSRSEAGGTRPGRPPQRYPAAEPYYPGASSRPAQRTPGYAGSSYEARGPPPSTRRYNNEPSRGYRDQESDYHSSYSRPGAMIDVRQPPYPATRRPDPRDHHQYNQDFRHGPPKRANRPITPEEYYSDGGPVQPSTQPSTEAEGSWSWNNLKKTVWGNSATDASQSRQMTPSPENDQAPGDRQPENQNTIWAKLATVGATFQKKLTNDEGYASDASDYEGESHLIRIMKKHHIEKAQSAHDLPDWLFSEAELREAQSRIKDSQYTNYARNRPGGDESHGEVGPQRKVGRAGLDDIYAAVDEGRSGHARQDSGSTKHSHDSGYGSAEPPRRRRGRYEDEVEYTPKVPPGRNRLEPMASRHPPPAQRAYNPPPPASHYSDSSRQYHAPRGYEGSRRPAPAPPRVAAPTTLDYFPPSGQNDRYPTPSKVSSSSSSAARRYAR